MLIHLDTDLAGDPDDVCALAMLLGWRGVELAGITTVADPDGRRAAYAREVLRLAGRPDIPVAPGAGTSLTTGGAMGALPDHHRYWGGTALDVPPEWPATASDLLATSIGAGAVVAAVGPQTNLAVLESAHPGVLRRTPLVAMAGWFDPVSPGLPQWGPAQDWNTRCDTHAALVVAEQATLTLVPLSATLRVHLTRRELPRLEAAGAVGRLVARQAQAYAEDQGKSALARAYRDLPHDLLNFHHDPLACAVAAGWDGATRRTVRIQPEEVEGALWYARSPTGRDVEVVDDVDATAFAAVWLSCLDRLAAAPG